MNNNINEQIWKLKYLGINIIGYTSLKEKIRGDWPNLQSQYDHRLSKGNNLEKQTYKDRC